MPRTLTTIGDLSFGQPLGRTRQRRRAMQLGSVTMGSATATTGGDALQTASLALLNAFEASGVTPESTVDGNVSAFQAAWNADPANSGDQLVADGKYGPLTYGALNAMVGGIAPLVNGGPAPVPAPTPAVPTAPGASSSHLTMWLLLAAAAIAAYMLLRKKKKGGGGRRRSAPLVEVRSNPRRLPARRRNAELIP
jgi:hypothetical protein